MWETLIGKLLSLIPSPWSGVRLKHRIKAELCTDGPPEPPGPLHIDVRMHLWVPEHRTTVHDLTAEAAGQKLEQNVGVTSFTAMTLEPGAKPEEQAVALGP